MSETAYITLTCPHCAKPLRASPADAGHEVRCPHPDCLRAVPVPPAPEDEPDEPVLLPEDPAVPQTVAAAPTLPSAPRTKPAAVPTPAPHPKPPREKPERPPRAPLLPWVLAAFACMVASGAITGWVMTATREMPAPASAESVAALAANNRDLRAENQKLRDQLAAPKPVAPAPAPAPKQPKEPEKSAAPENDDPLPPPVRRNPDPPAKPPEEPKPPPKADPPAKPAQARDAFVGMWSVNDPQLKVLQAEVTFEFRADGTSTIDIQTAGVNQGLTGTWRWDGRRLHLEIEGIPGGKPAEVKWNGADEFVATADNMPVTFRRKR